MRILTLLFILVIAGLAAPDLVASGGPDLAVSGSEPDDQPLSEKTEPEEELLVAGGGEHLTALSFAMAARSHFRQYSHSPASFPPPPRSA